MLVPHIAIRILTSRSYGIRLIKLSTESPNACCKLVVLYFRSCPNFDGKTMGALENPLAPQPSTIFAEKEMCSRKALKLHAQANSKFFFGLVVVIELLEILKTNLKVIIFLFSSSRRIVGK